jgi:diacylglycerol kinase
MSRKFSIPDRLKSFVYAWSGIKQVFRSEHNMWIHLSLAVVAIALAIFVKINKGEWVALVLVMALVVMAELFNTAIEKTMDFISKEKHPQIKQIKDIAAGAVLVAATAAIIVGCFIFIPKLFLK